SGDASSRAIHVSACAGIGHAREPASPSGPKSVATSLSQIVAPMCGLGSSFMCADRTLENQRVLTKLITELLDTKFARHKDELLRHITRRPSSAAASAILYKNTHALTTRMRQVVSRTHG